MKSFEVLLIRSCRTVSIWNCWDCLAIARMTRLGDSMTRWLVAALAWSLDRFLINERTCHRILLHECCCCLWGIHMHLLPNILCYILNFYGLLTRRSGLPKRRCINCTFMPVNNFISESEGKRETPESRSFYVLNEFLWPAKVEFIITRNEFELYFTVVCPALRPHPCTVTNRPFGRS